MAAPLLTGRARERLLAFSSVACSDVDLIYIEYRVSSDTADQVDVSLSAAGHAARAALAQQVKQLAVGGAASWQTAAGCLERWAIRGTDEARALRAACLEYDLEPGDGAAVPEPSLFFNAHELSHAWDRVRTRRGLRAALRWFLGPSASTLAAPLDTVIGALPTNFHLAHLGFMIPRPDERLRFCLALPRPELGPFLRRVGWGGSLTAFGDRADRVADFVALAERGGWVSIALGFGAGGTHPRLGIEAPAQGHPGGAPGLIEALRERGLCTRGKAEALRALLGAAGPEDRYELSHAKLSVSASGGLEAKAYVTLGRNDATMGRLASIRQIRGRAAPATPAAE